MGKYLSGSYGTGEKIIKNKNIFRWEFKDKEEFGEDKTIHRFSWTFDNYQYGHISIIVNENPYYIDESSLIDTDDNSPRKFKRPLGLYNDKTMHTVYEEMLRNEG